MFFQNSEGYIFQGLPLLLCLCVCCLRPSVLRLITNTVDSSFEPTGVLYTLVSFLVFSSMLSGPFCRQPLTYACKKCFLPPGLIFSQTQAFCFTQANPKCLEMPCFILTLLGEAANLGICCESLLSYSGRRQLQLPYLCGSASSVNTQLCGLDSETHLQFLNVQEEHGWAGVLIPTHHLCVNERHTKLLTVSDLSLSRSALFGFRFVHCQQRILHISRWRIALQCPELGSVLFINF